MTERERKKAEIKQLIDNVEPPADWKIRHFTARTTTATFTKYEKLISALPMSENRALSRKELSKRMGFIEDPETGNKLETLIGLARKDGVPIISKRGKYYLARNAEAYIKWLTRKNKKEEIIEFR